MFYQGLLEQVHVLGFPKFSELTDYYYYYVVLNMTSRVNTSLPHRGDRYKHMSVEQDRQNCQLII